MLHDDITLLVTDPRGTGMTTAERIEVGLPVGCPPAEAAPRSGLFYRYVAPALPVGGQPGADDWIPPHSKRKSPCFGCHDRCECHAHSLLERLDEAIKGREAVPALRRKAIASVAMSLDMGLLAHTPSDVGKSHHDWWPARPDEVPESVVVEHGG
jgi:hypothetical protein